MLLTEPMVTCMALYASFVYSLIYLTLEVYPIVFSEIRHYRTVISTLPFLGIFVGVLFALVVNFANQWWYHRAVKNSGGKAVPEARLPAMVIGGIFFSTGLFWFGWTAAPRYHWALPVIAGGKYTNTTWQRPISLLTMRRSNRSRFQYCFPAMHQFPC